MTDDEVESQIAAFQVHSQVPTPTRPMKTKVGFEIHELSLIHDACEQPCDEIKIVCFMDSPTLFRFAVIGKCKKCGIYVWDNKSIDADHRVVSYECGVPVSESRLVREE